MRPSCITTNDPSLPKYRWCQAYLKFCKCWRLFFSNWRKNKEGEMTKDKLYLKYYVFAKNSIRVLRECFSEFSIFSKIIFEHVLYMNVKSSNKFYIGFTWKFPTRLIPKAAKKPITKAAVLTLETALFGRSLWYVAICLYRT